MISIISIVPSFYSFTDFLYALKSSSVLTSRPIKASVSDPESSDCDSAFYSSSCTLIFYLNF